MCIGYPAEVTAVEGGVATVRTGAGRQSVRLGFATAAAVGDWVLVAAGQIIRAIGEAEGRELTRLLASVQTPPAQLEDDTDEPRT